MADSLFTGRVINKLFRRSYLYFIFFLLSLIANSKVLANSLALNTLRFEKLLPEDGLSQISINCILQDAQGFMWFGTQDGLNRYDGYQFTVFRSDTQSKDGLSSSYITALVNGSDDVIWIGTRGGGLNSYNKVSGRFTHYRHDPQNPNSLSDDVIWSMMKDSAGILWIATSNGLSSFDPQTQGFKHYQHDKNDPKSISSNRVYYVIESKRGDIWAGTKVGVNKLNRQSQTFERFVHEEGVTGSLSHNTVIVLGEDQQEQIWVGTWGGGLNRFDAETRTFKHYKHDPQNDLSIAGNYIWSIFVDASGTLWVGNQYGGLNVYDRQNDNFKHIKAQSGDPDSISDSSISAIYQSETKDLWFGTYYGGINKVDRYSDMFKRFRHNIENPTSLSSNSIFGLLEDGDFLWVGSDKGLNRINLKNGFVKHYRHSKNDLRSVSNDVVKHVVKQGEHHLWVGTVGGGLNLFDKRTETFTSFKHDPNDPSSISDNSAWAIYNDSKGFTWVGTGKGLNRFNEEDQSFDRYLIANSDSSNLSINTVSSIREDAEGNIWVGTDGGGINRLDQETGTFERFIDIPNKSQNFNYVQSIFFDSAGSLWVGSLGGLFQFNPEEGSFVTYDESNGLPNNVIYGILEDRQNNLWVSTNVGLSQFQRDKFRFTNFDSKDGLASNEFNSGAYHAGGSGNFYFGGPNGLTYFDPLSIKENTSPAKVVLTDLLLYNKSVSNSDVGSDDFLLSKNIGYADEVVLGYQDAIVSFEFTALNYRQSSKNHFRYRLKGFNDQWISTDYMHRRATYTGIPHGKYTFQVIAANDDGYWQDSGTSINLVVLPPPWLSVWAYTLYALIISGLAFWFFYSQRAIIKAHESSLKLKTDFLTSISHELRTPMNAIIGGLQLMEKQPLANLKGPFDIVQDGATDMLRLVNDILTHTENQSGNLSIKPRDVAIKPLMLSLYYKYKRACEEKGLELEWEMSAQLPKWLYVDDEKIVSIVTKLLDNAVKFTERGTVKFSLECDTTKSPWRLKICVSDSGIGISDEEKNKIFKAFTQKESGLQRRFGGLGIGLSICSKFIKILGGELRLESTEGKGSTFLAELPVNEGTPIEAKMSRSQKNLASANLPVLVVEDNVVNQKIMVMMLEKLGYNALVANHGQEAIDILGKEKVSIILMDIQMPVMDGFTCAEKIRQSDSDMRSISIIAVTANLMSADKERCIQSGMDDFLKKPVNIDVLHESLKKYLEDAKP